MSDLSVCILYTQDADLVRKVTAYLRACALVRHVAEGDRLESVLQQSGPSLLVVDLRAKDARDFITEVEENWPQILLIALGALRSAPLRDAEQADIYAAEDLEIDRRQFQALVSRAFEHLRLKQENLALLARANLAPMVEPTPPIETSMQALGAAASYLRFPRVFRHADDFNALMQNVVENVADTAGVGRVGIFARERAGEVFRLRAGTRCLPETTALEYAERDSLVRWFELHAHLISRQNLPLAADQTQRGIMQRALDSFGAEVIAPLHTRGRIMGWLFIGQRQTGQRFTLPDLENFTLLSEHVATVLENALLNREVARQKKLAESLLQSMPPGVVATDENAIIRWFNPHAEQILGLKAAEVMDRPVEAAGSRIASFLRETLEAKKPLPAQHWIDSNTQRSLAVEARRLLDDRTALGAVAVVQDLTSEENQRQKQELVERATFWSDLAASMSHEIRNPLVAIKTFAQLLPERFEDEEFRKDFNRIVVQEIDRLDKIISQINSFAHPPELVLKPLDLHAPVRNAVEFARKKFKTNGAPVELNLPNDLPTVLGDESALTEAFAHLVANAAEATRGQSKPSITLAARPVRDGRETSGVMVTVRDNGTGIAPDLKDKIFSPFCTTKARGMGLGLSIVKRTVFDHHGRVDVDSNPQGTAVSVILPTTNGHHSSTGNGH